jgi:hypothetical protein
MNDEAILSKEILNEILSEDVVRIESSNLPLIEILVQRWSYRERVTINIYELMHLAKEKAKEYGYYIYSGPKNDNIWQAWYSPSGSSFENVYSYKYSEEESVIDIFKHIINNK